MTKPPRRLLDDQQTSAALRRHLTAAADSESEYDAAAGFRRFEAGLLAAGIGSSDPSVASAPARAGSASKSLAFKLAWTSVAGIAVIGAGVYIGAPALVPVPVPARTATQSEPLRPTDLPPPAADVQPAAPKPTIEPTTPPRSAAEPARAKVSSAPQSEIARVLRARELLDGDPKTALAILRELDQDSPHGVLRQERDALTVLAWRNLGDPAKARSLAQRFVTRYPDSPMRERLRPLLDDTQDTTPHD